MQKVDIEKRDEKQQKRLQYYLEQLKKAKENKK